MFLFAGCSVAMKFRYGKYDQRNYAPSALFSATANKNLEIAWRISREVQLPPSSVCGNFTLTANWNLLQKCVHNFEIQNEDLWVQKYYYAT